MNGICRRVFPILLLGIGACAANSARVPVSPLRYTAYVANEASDIVTRLVFDPASGITAERRIIMGSPGRIEGPHGLAVSPDARHWYVALAHGRPNGSVARYSVGGDTAVARVAVGAFPQSLALTHDGQYLFVANNNLHGGASGVSVIYTQTMTEVARPTTCAEPMSGAVSSTRSRYYSVCAASDQLVEIDTRSFQVTRRFSLAPGREAPIPTAARETGRRTARDGGCIPSAVEAGRGVRADVVYVACTRSGEVLEIDAKLWTVARRFKAPDGPVALRLDATAATLFVAMSTDSAIAVIDLVTGDERGRVRTSQAGPREIALTTDGRYLFVTNEGAGTARGTVDVIDTATLRRVAAVAVEYTPGGVALLPR